MTDSERFDPLKEIRQGTFCSESQLQELNLRALSPLQRALLVIDGTVTSFIEAYMMEPVEVQRIRQERCPSSSQHRWLQPEPAEEIIEREVLIRGGYTGTLYVYAISFILPTRLPAQIRNRLDVQGEGIGRIILDEKLETRREVLWFGRERLESPPSALGEQQTEFISRAYRIMYGERPIVMINERFPWSLRRLPEHH